MISSNKLPGCVVSAVDKLEAAAARAGGGGGGGGGGGEPLVLAGAATAAGRVTGGGGEGGGGEPLVLAGAATAGGRLTGGGGGGGDARDKGGGVLSVVEGDGTESVASAAARAAGTGGGGEGAGGGTGGVDTFVLLFCSCELAGAAMPRSCGVSAVSVSSCGLAGGESGVKRAIIRASALSALVAFFVASLVAFT